MNQKGISFLKYQLIYFKELTSQCNKKPCKHFLKEIGILAFCFVLLCFVSFVVVAKLNVFS